MSDNSQTLIVEEKGRFWIFLNVNAEAWEEGEHTLSKKSARGVFDNREDAMIIAGKWDEEESQFGEGSEYGVWVGKLAKDDTLVKIVD